MRISCALLMNEANLTCAGLSIAVMFSAQAYFRDEAVTICLVDPRTESLGSLIADFPPASSILSFDQFFDRLYQQYDLRFIYAAPGLKTVTRRLEWDPGAAGRPVEVQSAVSAVVCPDQRPAKHSIRRANHDG